MVLFQELTPHYLIYIKLNAKEINKMLIITDFQVK